MIFESNFFLSHFIFFCESELQYVTCGSIISLVHVPTNSRLHSHDVKYGGGSGQQSVTGFADQGDTNNYWLVREAHGSPPCAGFNSLSLSLFFQILPSFFFFDFF